MRVIQHTLSNLRCNSIVITSKNLKFIIFLNKKKPISLDCFATISQVINCKNSIIFNTFQGGEFPGQ